MKCLCCSRWAKFYSLYRWSTVLSSHEKMFTNLTQREIRAGHHCEVVWNKFAMKSPRMGSLKEWGWVFLEIVLPSGRMYVGWQFHTFTITLKSSYASFIIHDWQQEMFGRENEGRSSGCCTCKCYNHHTGLTQNTPCQHIYIQLTSSIVWSFAWC